MLIWSGQEEKMKKVGSLSALSRVMARLTALEGLCSSAGVSFGPLRLSKGAIFISGMFPRSGGTNSNGFVPLVEVGIDFLGENAEAYVAVTDMETCSRVRLYEEGASWFVKTNMKDGARPWFVELERFALENAGVRESPDGMSGEVADPESFVAVMNRILAANARGESLQDVGRRQTASLTGRLPPDEHNPLLDGD